MLIENIKNTVLQNSLPRLNETSTGDIAFQEKLISEILEFTLSESILDKMATVIPMSTPSMKFFSKKAYYAGSPTAKFDNQKVIKLQTLTPFNVGDIVTSGGFSAKITYQEENKILVEITAGTISIGNTLTSGAKNAVVKNIYSSAIALKKMFRSYSGPVLTADGEVLKPREINYKVKDTTLTAKTKKIKSVLTREAITDIRNQYGENAVTTIAQILAGEIRLEVQQEIFDYLRAISVECGDLVVTDRLGETDLIYAYSIIYTKLAKEIANISKRTGRDMVGFTIMSHQTIAALSASGALDLSKGGSNAQAGDKKNSDFIGKALGYINVIKSDYQDDEEVIVGYFAGNDTPGDAGLIFSPYTLNVVFEVNPDTGEENVIVYYRYAYSVNPFDEGTGINDSDYFSRYTVDFSQVQQLV